MKMFLPMYFFCMALVQAGLLLGAYRHQFAIAAKPNRYWLSSLAANILALCMFAVGIVFVKDITNPQFDFTIANTLFFVAVITQVLFCRSLVGAMSSKKIKIWLSVATSCFFISIEYLRQQSNFDTRTLYVAVIMSCCYVGQIYYLTRNQKHHQSTQLRYLLQATSLELACSMTRTLIVLLASQRHIQFEQIPLLLIISTLLQVAMGTLSYAFIGNFWVERISSSYVKIKTAKETSEKKLRQIEGLLQEKERLINSLVKANKVASAGALTATFAHQLNQPLGSSRISIEYLLHKIQEQTFTPELAFEVLNDLASENQRASQAVKGLRSLFADPDQPGAIVDITSLILDLIEIVKADLGSSGIEIKTSLEEGLYVSANAHSLRQVFINLINNAHDALVLAKKKNRQIWITASRGDAWIKIEVIDNGNGVLPEQKKHLFEPLNSEKNTGMGLGLWICRQILNRYQGDISHENIKDGGACFAIELPAARCNTEAPATFLQS